MDIKPIKPERQHRQARREIERLWDAKPGSPEQDRLEVLATLVESYEEAHHAILPPDPIAAIKFRMEQLGLDRRDLEKCIGSRARACREVLSKKRRLTLGMIRKLHAELGIPAEILLAS